jgi:acyl-CoA thioester hydrolase
MKKNKNDDLSTLYPEELKNKKFFTTEINVRWEEMDINGHINYACYMDYYSEARIEAVGQDVFKSLREKGMGPVIYKAEIDFIKELFHPDRIHIVTWMDELIGKTRVSLRQDIYSTGRKELISKSKFHAIFMDLKSRRPVRMPEELKKHFEL